MEDEVRLVLKVGDIHPVTLQSRGATGLQLHYQCDDETVVAIEKQESNVSARDLASNLGGPIPAVFLIRALKSGKAKLIFYETRPWDKNFKPLVQKTFLVEVI